MKVSALLVLAAVAFAAKHPEVDTSNPREIALEAVKNYQKDQMAALNYTSTETDDKKGRGVDLFHVETVEGTPYERLIGKNGKPLSEDAEKRELEKFEKTERTRKNELKGQRDRRIRAYKEQSRFLEEAPDAFNFVLLPEETVDGRAAFVLRATPKDGYEARSPRSRMFADIEAKAWVDKQDLRILKVEADVLRPVSIGFILARVTPGTHMEMEQMRLPDETWVTKKLSIEGRAKVLLVDNKQLDETATYSDFTRVANAKPVR